jgi:hypothetical protein
MDVVHCPPCVFRPTAQVRPGAAVARVAKSRASLRNFQTRNRAGASRPGPRANRPQAAALMYCIGVFASTTSGDASARNTKLFRRERLWSTSSTRCCRAMPSVSSYSPRKSYHRSYIAVPKRTGVCRPSSPRRTDRSVLDSPGVCGGPYRDCPSGLWTISC